MEQTQEIKGKVTVEALRGLRVGETAVFLVPSVADIYTGRTLASGYGQRDGVRYATKSDIPGLRLTVTRMAQHP